MCGTANSFTINYAVPRTRSRQLRSRRGEQDASSASTGRGIHLRIRSLRRRGVGGSGGAGVGGFVVPAVALRHQKTLEKKKSQRLYNSHIEETAGKLVKTRKSRVKAYFVRCPRVRHLQDCKRPDSPPRPYPECFFGGSYVKNNQFAPVLPRARSTIPSIWIRPINWLADVLAYLGVDEVDKETFQITDSPLWKGWVDFNFPRCTPGQRPIELSVYGKSAIDALLTEKYAVIKAVDLLADAGFVFPSYSSMVVQYMAEEASYYNVEHFCLTKAEKNTMHLVPDGSMTFAGCSFEATFDQCMLQCGYIWEYAPESPVLTTEGYQAKLEATKVGSAGEPSLTVLSRPRPRAAEAVENVLCTALSFINDDCGYKIGDLHYADLLLLLFRRKYPGLVSLSH